MLKHQQWESECDVSVRGIGKKLIQSSFYWVVWSAVVSHDLLGKDKPILGKSYHDLDIGFLSPNKSDIGQATDQITICYCFLSLSCHHNVFRRRFSFVICILLFPSRV